MVKQIHTELRTRAFKRFLHFTSQYSFLSKKWKRDFEKVQTFMNTFLDKACAHINFVPGSLDLNRCVYHSNTMSHKAYSTLVTILVTSCWNIQCMYDRASLQDFLGSTTKSLEFENNVLLGSPRTYPLGRSIHYNCIFHI